MAFARVVEFDGVTPERVEQLRQEISAGERPAEIPAKEIMLLHDAEAGTALAILMFDSEDDYKRGDEVLSAMPGSDTPGSRRSVKKYSVAIRAEG